MLFDPEFDKSSDPAPMPGAAPTKVAGSRPQTNSAAAPPKGKRGPLLDLPEEEAFKKAHEEWKKHRWFHQIQAGLSKRNSMWRSGERYLRIEKIQDQNIFRIITPIGTSALPPSPNKVEEEVRNAKAIITSDPPRPECEPSGDTAQQRDAAQFATRFLGTLATESSLNTDAILDGAMDIAATYSSGFAHVCFDPAGGGLVPLTIKARPSATTKDTAIMGELPPDPTTGAPVWDSAPFVVKFVTEGGELTDTPADAQLSWQPGLKIDLYNSNQVKFLPRTCMGIGDAEGVIIGSFQTLGALRKYPAIEELKPDQLWELVTWRVDDYKRLLPDGFQYTPPNRRDADDKDSPPEEDALVCILTCYRKSSNEYPFGCYTVFAGGKYRICEEELMGEAPDEKGRMRKEPLAIPVAQMRWTTTTHLGNPYGDTTVSLIGPLDEIRANIYGAAQEYTFRFLRPRMLLPMGTTVQPEDMDDPERTIYFNPQGKPEWQPIPDFPQMGMQLIDRVDQEINNSMGIQPSALGQVAGSVRSAEQTNTLIEQSNVALTSLRANALDFYERLHRLILQIARVRFTAPQLMQYRGEDGAYQSEEFTNLNFSDTKVVRVRWGTGTMMSPTAKSDMIDKEFAAQALSLPEMQRLKRDSISSIIGLQDNPHTLRVRRQLNTWRKGPPEEGLPQPQPQIDQATGLPAIDQMTGQPLPPISPFTLAVQQIFQPLPIDEEMDVAALRHQELSRAVAEIEFFSWPPEWKQGLIDAYMFARQASGIQTIMEQQQAMAAQAQQEQQVAQQQADADEGRKQEAHGQKMAQGDEAHGAKMEQGNAAAAQGMAQKQAAGEQALAQKVQMAKMQRSKGK